LIIAGGGEEIPASILAAVGGPAGQPARFTEDVEEELLEEGLARYPAAFTEDAEEELLVEELARQPAGSAENV
jgi:hypothetical protein